MKIAIIGFSGAGKSTLARKLSNHYSIPVLHLDTCHFKPNWQKRTDEEMTEIVSDFLKNEENWVIEGNYVRICKERFLVADLVIGLFYNRFFCLKSVIQRYKTFKNKVRPDIADGCIEKLDGEFLKWVFYKGRSSQKKRKYRKIIFASKQGLIFKSRKQLLKYLKKLGVENYEASM